MFSGYKLAWGFDYQPLCVNDKSILNSYDGGWISLKKVEILKTHMHVYPPCWRSF